MLIVLTGKTASGKDTLKSALLQKYPNFKKITTTTSRAKRPNETEGEDYYFLSRDEFIEKVKAGLLAEHVEYGGNLYGTYKSELEKALTSDMIWRIDPSRAGEVRDFIDRTYPKRISDELINRILVIYVTVDSDVVLQRLRSRNLAEVEINKRIQDDARIWETYKDSYDYILENEPGKLGETLDKIVEILEKHQ